MFGVWNTMAKKQNYIWQNDRNFALDKYEQQKYYYVVESNDLISKAKHDLTTNQLKIIDFLVLLQSFPKNLF